MTAYDTTELHPLADANAAQAARLFAAHEPGAVTEERDGMLLVAGAHPINSLFHCAARRTDPAADAETALAAAADFSTRHGHPLALWANAGTDADLVETALAAGYSHKYSLAGMVLAEAPAAGVPGPGVRMRRVTDEAGVADFAKIHGDLFAEAGRPAEAAAHFASSGVLLAPHVAGFVAYLDGEPAACAMTVHTGTAAGLFEVATAPAARRRGLGELVSRAAVRAGFELGGSVAVLQATALGEPVYRRIGFEKFTEYGAIRPGAV